MLVTRHRRLSFSMNEQTTWKTDDFDAMSWHDVNVHGFRLEAFSEDAGCADLVLDIDYLLEWISTDGGFEFKVAPAELRFHEVFGLRFELDYSTGSAGMCPFSIDGIVREAVTFPTGHASFRWTMPVNWPSGSLRFEAPRFTMSLTGPLRVQNGQAILAGRGP